MCAMTINANSGYGVYNLGLGLNGSSSSSSSSTSSTSASPYSSGGVESLSTRELRDRINTILEDVPKSGSKVSFQDVIDYRDKLQAEFEAKAKADLDALGVDTERDFTLSYDAGTNKVTVDSGHPDKKIIDKYFEDKPEMRDAFAKIVTLSKLSGCAEKKLSPTAFKQQMQQQAMTWWAESNGGNDWFTGGGMMMQSTGMKLLAGVNRQV